MRRIKVKAKSRKILCLKMDLLMSHCTGFSLLDIEIGMENGLITAMIVLGE